MSPAGNTWNRVEDVFAQALALPARDRDSFVKDACSGDRVTQDEVLRLLNARNQMGDFLEAPALDLRGQLFGPYRATREIARGGMSVVYLGERSDGDFEKRVAIKVILLQSAGALGQGETQILASLEHLNIVRLLDAGSTPLGFRYLVMEFVEGIPCTQHCAKLDEVEKLRLFLQVCAGVHFAHRSLVVHRDLKPENILVSADGIAKILDFGIAKMLAAQGQSGQTTGLRAFTADYASPEQILGQPVTTSTDIYSLGVVLCELISGRPLRERSGLSWAELVQWAQTSEVTDVPVKGDLSLIVRKALRRDPAERYASVSEMARDVERYLDGMPIEARRPEWGYRVSKFVARHAYAVTAATLTAIVLAASAGVAIWQAKLASTRFDQVRSLARSVMFELHDAVSPLPGSLAARKLIVERSLVYLDHLAADTSATVEVQLDVARGYLRLADIQGKDYGGASVGQSAAALARARQAVEVARRVVARDPNNVEGRKVLIDGLDYSASAYLVRGEPSNAIPLATEGVERAEQVLKANPSDVSCKERLAAITKQLATALSENGQNEKAILLYQRALELRKELLAADPTKPSAQQRLAEAHQWLGSKMLQMKEYPQAEAHAREALRLDTLRYRSFPRQTRANLAADIGLLAVVAAAGNRHEEEVARYKEQLRYRREIAAEDPASHIAALRVGATLDRIGAAYLRWGKHTEAIQFGEMALEAARRIRAVDPENSFANRELIYSMVDLAQSYSKASKPQRSCAMAREALQLVKQPLKGLRSDVERQIELARKIDVSCSQ